MTDPRRSIPAVDTLLEAPAFSDLVRARGRDRVLSVLRAVQAELREGLSDGGARDGAPAEPDWYAERVAVRLAREDRPSLRGVINATGVVLHTNLGRAPLAEAAVRAVTEVASYGTLEYDVESGRRGSRYAHCVPLLRDLTGAGDAVVVNNAAAALVLALNTLAQGRSAVISRGELVEIGGSFRVPDIMGRSGARMLEVGSTNRTHPSDYRDALSDDDAAVVLKVHRSNFRIEGFAAEVPALELARIAEDAGVPLIHDLGSGALVDLSAVGLPDEPTAGDAVAAGAHVVVMSGDKLLGGPQAGIILGSGELVARMRRNPLCRALRPDKLTLASLEATLALYRDGRAWEEVPVLRMLAATGEALGARADGIVGSLAALGVAAERIAGRAAVGGGAFPGVEIPGPAVALDPSFDADAVARVLRTGDPAVVGRIRDGRLILDPRTVPPERDGELVRLVAGAASTPGAVKGPVSP